MGMRVPSDVLDAIKAYVSASRKDFHWQGRAFCKNVTGFLEEWLAATRMGQDFGQTSMGYVSQRRPLRSDHTLLGLRMRAIVKMDLGLNLIKADLAMRIVIAISRAWMNDGDLVTFWE